jgi:hypothetical protein
LSVGHSRSFAASAALHIKKASASRYLHLGCVKGALWLVHLKPSVQPKHSTQNKAQKEVQIKSISGCATCKAVSLRILASRQ